MRVEFTLTEVNDRTKIRDKIKEEFYKKYSNQFTCVGGETHNVFGEVLWFFNEITERNITVWLDPSTNELKTDGGY
jgi:hypothetical protein